MNGELSFDRKSNVNVHLKKGEAKFISDQRKRSTKWLSKESERFPFELSDYKFYSFVNFLAVMRYIVGVISR